MAFTEFYMLSGGSNLNAGSTSGSAVYTSAGGNWVNATRVFTPTDGQTTSSLVNVGDFASVYVTIGATATGFIGRVTAVGAGVNGTITISATISAGSNPSDGTGTITVKTGGAWVGPGAAVTFPFNLTGIGSIVDTSSDRTRINIKNDQTYSMTSALDFGNAGSSVIQGYSSSVGDGGKASFTSNLTSGANFTQNSSSQTAFIDLNFANTGAVNSNHVFSFGAGTTCFFLRCVFHGGRGSGLNYSGAAIGIILESEAYDNNKSNSSNFGGFSCSSGTLICHGSYSHDNTGSNSSGFINSSSGGMLVLFNCISDTNSGTGALTASQSSLIAVNSDFYNNTSDAIKFNSASTWIYSYIVNNNFIKNGGKGVNNAGNVTQPGIIYNNGRGAGTQANGGSDTLGAIVNGGTDITYPNDMTPWVAPTTGNFTINLINAMNAGRFSFTETDGTNTGTVGYPDVGAAQALCSSAQSGFILWQ